MQSTAKLDSEEVRRIDRGKELQIQAFENIPAELRSRPQWVLRLGKKPIDPNTGYGAKAGNPATWGRYEAVLERFSREDFSGIGFELDNNGLVGIDLDHVVNPETGELHPDALRVVQLLDSYTEFSPSGTGLHILAYGEIPADGRQADVEKGANGETLRKYEIYKAGRYLTMTGQVFGECREVRQRAKEVRTFYQEYFGQEDGQAVCDVPSGFDDGSDLQRGLQHDKKLQALWGGARKFGDESRDDQALMNKLAYWCNCDMELMCKAFRESDYAVGKDEEHQKKMLRDDYLPRTAKKAVEGCRKTAAGDREEFRERKTQLPFDVVVPEGERSLSAAIHGASQLEKKPWISEKEKMDKSTGETVIIYTVLTTVLASFIRDRVPMVVAKEGSGSAGFCYVYDKGVYRKLDDNDLKSVIRRFIPNDLFRSRDVDEVFKDLLTSVKRIRISDLNDNEGVINFYNGLLRLDNMELIPHDSAVYSTIQIPCNWNPGARFEQNSVFMRYMDDLTDGDKDMLEILLEAIGLVLSNVYGYRTKKAIFMVGAGDSGKTQIKELLAKLLGIDNFISSSLQELSVRFGLYDVYQKRLVGSNDMRYQDVDDMDKFKQLTGGDTLRLEPKGESPFSYVFRGFCWFNMNDLPRFGGDKGEHVYRRILPIYCNNVIPPERQDKDIVSKMLREREAIVVAAVWALKRLIQQNYIFPETESVKAIRQQYSRDNNSLLSFLSDCCEQKPVPPKDRLKRSVFKDAYRLWCRQNNRLPLCDRDIRKLMEGEGIQDVKTQGAFCYADLALTEDFKEEYRFYDGAIIPQSPFTPGHSD